MFPHRAASVNMVDRPGTFSVHRYHRRSRSRSPYRSRPQGHLGHYRDSQRAQVPTVPRPAVNPEVHQLLSSITLQLGPMQTVHQADHILLYRKLRKHIPFFLLKPVMLATCTRLSLFDTRCQQVSTEALMLTRAPSRMQHQFRPLARMMTHLGMKPHCFAPKHS